MKRRDVILTALGGAMLVLIAVFAVRIVSHYQSAVPGARSELGRIKITQLSESTRDRLQALRHDVLITFYISGREHLPSNMRRLERDVVDLLSAMQRESKGRLTIQIVDPHAEPDFVRHAAHQRVAPYRVRSVSRDSWTERTVWSTLHIAYGPHEAAVINGVSPEHLPRLQSMIVGHLDQKDRPRSPVFAVAGPAVYRDFTRWLARNGRVISVDLQSGEPIPDEADVLFWMDPGEGDAELVRSVQRYLDAGRSVVVAGSRHAVVHEDDGSFQLRPTRYDAEFLLAPFGLRPIDGMVLDQSSQTVQYDPAPLPARFLIRCIAPNQDFREMRDLPNGHLLFAAPTPLTIDREVLAERGLSPTVLATTSDRTSIAEMIYGPVNLASAQFHQGDPVPKLPLMVWLRPHEPWRGSLVVSASSSPFRDGAFQAENYAHRRLADVLTDTLASDERLVIHDAGFEQAQPLPPMSATSRTLWRVACIAILPLLLVGIALRRGGLRPVAGGFVPVRHLPMRGIAMGTTVVLVVSVAVAIVPPLRVDMTADQTNRLAHGTSTLAKQAVDDRAIELTLYFSRPQNLPPDMRPLVRRLRAMIGHIRAAGADLHVNWVHPEDLDETARGQLEAGGVKPHRLTTRDEDMTIVRTVYSTIRFETQDQSVLLEFPDSVSFEHLEFRLAFAISRVLSGRRPHVAFAADVPRLSAAEAYHDFQQRSLLAPTGTDVYSHARAALEQAGFRVTHINPASPDVPDDVDVIVWMQPRRSILPLLEQVVARLHSGVPVVIAAQHFNMQARQYRGAQFETVYWPQPQVADLHLHYLPELGVELVHEVLFDDLNGQMPLQTQINRASGERDYEMQVSALPFLIRAAAANFLHAHPVMRNLGDQLLPFAGYWRLDDQALAEHGITAVPLMTTSQRSWSYNWEGGWIPQQLLEAPPADDDGQLQWQGRLPLAVLLEGKFPRPAEPLTHRRVDSTATVELHDAAGNPSKLLLIGSSEMFKNHRLRDEQYRADQLLLNAVSSLTLEDHLASVASHRHVSRGFDYVDVHRRLQWRGIVLAAGPLAMLLLGMTWFTARRRRTKWGSGA